MMLNLLETEEDFSWFGENVREMFSDMFLDYINCH
jgi:hypothetical protein